MKMRIVFPFIAVFLYLTLYSGTSAASNNGGFSYQVDLVLGSLQDEGDYIFGELTSVVEDSDGRIYVADRSQYCVHKFANNGEYISQLGKSGDGPGDIMPDFVIAIDRTDKLYIAGQGGRVEVVDTDWNYVASFRRRNPASIARSVALFPDGHIAIAARGQSTDTTVDLYTTNHSYERSFSKSFSFGSGFPRHIEAAFVGGYATVSSKGKMYFAQLAPFLVRVFDSFGAVIDSTTAGGSEFVEYPPAPLIDGGTITYFNSSKVTGIVAIGDGGILVSAVDHVSEGVWITQFYAFDSELNLVGCLKEDGLLTVVGGAGDGTIFLRSDGNQGKRLLRAKAMVR